MNNKFYSDDIAICLCRLAEVETTGEDYRQAEEALYELKTIASNEHNRDCYRVLWNLLQELADKHQRLIYQ